MLSTLEITTIRKSADKLRALGHDSWSILLTAIADRASAEHGRKGITANGWAVKTNFQKSKRHFSEVHVGTGTAAEKDIAKRCYPFDFNPEVVPVTITETAGEQA